MRFDDKLSIPAATVDADPIATPANVPQARTFQLRRREPSNDTDSVRILAGLLGAAVTESVSFVLWALDDDSDSDEWVPAATDQWVEVWQCAGLQGGESRQSSPGDVANAFIGGGGADLQRDRGRFYLQVVDNALADARMVGIRATI